MVRSPLLAAICTCPSTSVTWNSVQLLPAGFTVTSPAVVARPREVATRTVPCSISTAGPSNFTSESEPTITLDPAALKLAVESDRVCTRSPEKTAADLGTVLPFSQAAPFVYSMAEAESAASNCIGNSMASRQLSKDLYADCDMFQFTPATLAVATIVACTLLRVNDLVGF